MYHLWLVKGARVNDEEYDLDEHDRAVFKYRVEDISSRSIKKMTVNNVYLHASASEKILLILKSETINEFLKQGIFHIHSNTRAQKTPFSDGNFFAPTPAKHSQPRLHQYGYEQFSKR
jgi:hypothetical protein